MTRARLLDDDSDFAEDDDDDMVVFTKRTDELGNPLGQEEDFAKPSPPASARGEGGAELRGKLQEVGGGRWRRGGGGCPPPAG